MGMMEFLTYDLKVAVLLAVFYMFYRLLLSRETFHRVNRLVLLTTAVLSFVLPLCVITLHKTVVVEAAAGAVSIGGISAALVESEPQMPFWQPTVIALFFVGVVATLGYTLMSVVRVWLLIRKSERHPQADGTTIAVTDSDVSPFSWMHYIVLSRSDYEANDASLLAHERGHIRLHHSLDLLLVDTLTALQWFNPAMWMLRQDLRAIHEYEADAAVLSQGINMRQYQYLLIQKAVANCGYSVANGISHSTLKNRINMMLHRKSSSANLLKLFALIPIVGVALALNAETVNDYVYADKPQTPQKKVVKKGKKSAEVKINTTTIEVKEAKPEAKEEKAEAAPAPEPLKDVKIIMGEAGDKEPLLIIDGKVATREQLQTLVDQKEIYFINVLKYNKENKDFLRAYGNKHNADTSNGIINIITKEYCDSVDRKVQEEAKKPKDYFDVVEQMPDFPGGAVEMMKFLSENVKYPEEAFSKGIEGRVIANFIVETDGTITNVKVIKKVSDEIDAEAVRLIKSMPKWKPGMQNGKPVRVKYTIPVSFRLN